MSEVFVEISPVLTKLFPLIDIPRRFDRLFPVSRITITTEGIIQQTLKLNGRELEGGRCEKNRLGARASEQRMGGSSVSLPAIR